MPSPEAPAATLWSAAAHDLRQPMQAIKLLSRVVADEPDACERRKIGARLELVAQSLQVMLDWLSEISALATSPCGPDVADCRLDDLLAGVAGEFDCLVGQRGGSVVLDTDAAANVTVRTNPRLLRELIRGLTMHALWLDPAARVTFRATKDSICVETARPLTGDGCPSRVFTELSVTAAGATRPVLGFGYRMVEHVAPLLGLTVSTRPAPGGGTALVLGPFA